jgi:hypothetical protein
MTKIGTPNAQVGSRLMQAFKAELHTPVMCDAHRF